MQQFNFLSRMTSTICFLLLLFLPQLSIGQSHCLEYEPAKVELAGRLVKKTYPGPPGYESIARGDRAETSWFLTLAHPICVATGKNEPELTPAQKDIRIVQLVVQNKTYQKRKSLLGKPVIVSGTLFAGHAGHHHTAVLLTVSTIHAVLP